MRMRIGDPFVPTRDRKGIPRTRIVLARLPSGCDFSVLFLAVSAVVDVALIKDRAAIRTPDRAARTRRDFGQSPSFTAVKRQNVDLRNLVALTFRRKHDASPVRRPRSPTLTGLRIR